MQVTETVSDGLKREFQITVPAADLEVRLSGRLNELKDRVQLRGFRPGKVPVTHLRKVYGRSVMAETLENLIRETNAKIVEERGLRLAREPKVTIPNEETEVDRVISGQGRLPIRCPSRCCRPSRSAISRPSRSSGSRPRSPMPRSTRR